MGERNPSATDGGKASRILIEDIPNPGAWNMAFDAALLDGALARGEAMLRVYRWSEATLSLGHFQKQIPDDLPLPLQMLPRVRRLSGGGAILHHHEWTYSCVVPPGHRLARRNTVLYEVVHAALIEAFGQLGIGAELRGESSSGNPFLCFLRGDPRDILVRGHKITGSAQRRRRGAVLQHGSVLLRASPLAPAIPGLLDLTSAHDPSNWFGRDEFVAALSPNLFANCPDRTPHPDDWARAGEILKSGATPAIIGGAEVSEGGRLRQENIHGQMSGADSAGKSQDF